MEHLSFYRAIFIMPEQPATCSYKEWKNTWWRWCYRRVICGYSPSIILIEFPSNHRLPDQTILRCSIFLVSFKGHLWSSHTGCTFLGQTAWKAKSPIFHGAGGKVCNVLFLLCCPRADCFEPCHHSVFFAISVITIQPPVPSLLPAIPIFSLPQLTLHKPQSSQFSISMRKSGK